MDTHPQTAGGRGPCRDARCRAGPTPLACSLVGVAPSMWKFHRSGRDDTGWTMGTNQHNRMGRSAGGTNCLVRGDGHRRGRGSPTAGTRRRPRSGSGPSRPRPSRPLLRQNPSLSCPDGRSGRRAPGPWRTPPRCGVTALRHDIRRARRALGPVFRLILVDRVLTPDGRRQSAAFRATRGRVGPGGCHARCRAR